MSIASGSAGASLSPACPGLADPGGRGWTGHAAFGFALRNRCKCRLMLRQRKQQTVINIERDTQNSDQGPAIETLLCSKLRGDASFLGWRRPFIAEKGDEEL